MLQSWNWLKCPRQHWAPRCSPPTIREECRQSSILSCGHLQPGLPAVISWNWAIKIVLSPFPMTYILIWLWVVGIEFKLVPLLELGCTLESPGRFVEHSSTWASPQWSDSVCPWWGVGISPLSKFLNFKRGCLHFLSGLRTTALYGAKSAKRG